MAQEKGSFLTSTGFLVILLMICIGVFGLMGYAFTQANEDVTQFTLYTNENLGNKNDTKYYVEFYLNNAIIKNKKVEISKEVYDNLNKEKKFHYSYAWFKGNKFVKISDVQFGTDTKNQTQNQIQK